MRGLLLILALFALPAAVSAQTVERVEISKFGIYTSRDISKSVRPDGIEEVIDGDSRWLQQTDTIPARIGVKFGIRFKLEGAPGAVTLRRVTIVPEPGLRPRPGKPIKRVERDITLSTGDSIDAGWSFDHAYELLTGIWTIQIWQGDRKLAEKKFKVVPAEDRA
ncbi:MAG: DUF3859 domain-containing protein [Alphaproteobacteria bacterium]